MMSETKRLPAEARDINAAAMRCANCRSASSCRPSVQEEQPVVTLCRSLFLWHVIWRLRSTMASWMYFSRRPRQNALASTAVAARVLAQTPIRNSGPA